jgi:membrane protein implicated in regulation of membrane protease activity
MGKFLNLTLISLGGWLGWYLGYGVNIWVALVLAAVGSGLGAFLYRRFLEQYQ